MQKLHFFGFGGKNMVLGLIGDPSNTKAKN